jgi:hypothetical protein
MPNLGKQRIAVAAINPHAGEGGMFGREDMDILAPAVRQCAADGIDVSGPYSADSLYYRAHQGEFDVVIAPYHDQGLIPHQTDCSWRGNECDSRAAVRADFAGPWDGIQHSRQRSGRPIRDDSRYASLR